MKTFHKFNLCLFCLKKKCKRNRNQTKEIIWSTTLSILFKNVQKKMKMVQPITKRKRLSAQQITKFFTNLNFVYFVLKKCKRNRNQTKEIIGSTDCKTKKSAKKLKIVQLITKRKKLSAEQITKVFQRIFTVASEKCKRN